MKLHIGCGGKRIDGFLHIDIMPISGVDYVSDARVLPHADGTIEMIYASHVLEHFGRHEYAAALREWYRVLRPGGVLRLAVPDFACCAALYVEGGLARGLSDIIGLMVGGQRNGFDYHRMVFDEPLLTTALQAAGFRTVRRWDWRTTEHASVDDYSQAYLPHMDKQAGRLVSLNLEAVR